MKWVTQAGLVGYGKKWEKLPVNKNNKVIKVKMHVKTGDHVIVIAGSDKGKTGDITKARSIPPSQISQMQDSRCAGNLDKCGLKG